MKTLVLSDIHIGDPRLNNEDSVVELLQTTDYDRLILNGDFLDMWLLGYKRAVRKSKIVKAIKDLQQEVIWVRGNHDPIDFKQKVLPNATVRDTYITTINGKKTMFLHGHQVYPFKNMAWWQKLAANFNSAVYKLCKLDIQNLWRKTDTYKQSVAKKRQEIIDVYGKTNSVLVIGHTHVPTNQGKVFDGGSVMLTGHYIYISDSIEIKQL